MEQLIAPHSPGQLFDCRDSNPTERSLRWLNANTEHSGWGSSLHHDAELVIRELTSNLQKYATDEPFLCLQLCETSDQNLLLEIAGIDKGPGIEDVPSALEAKEDSSESLGIGLGAIKRNSIRSDIYSDADSGTIVYARIGESPDSPLQISGWGIPAPEEETCGDQWWVGQQEGVIRLLMADGLGHGPEAHNAASKAVKEHSMCETKDLEEALQNVHEALRPTRGAVVAIADIYLDEDEIALVGVGNITSVILRDEGTKRLTSFGGTCGHKLRTINVVKKPFRPGNSLMMHSDGISDKWIDSIPDVPNGLLLPLLLRDYRRDADDKSGLVLSR